MVGIKFKTTADYFKEFSRKRGYACNILLTDEGMKDRNLILVYKTLLHIHKLIPAIPFVWFILG